MEYKPVRINADVANTLTEIRRRLDNIPYRELEKLKLSVKLPKQFRWKRISRSDTVELSLLLLDYKLTKLGYKKQELRTD